MPLLLNRLMDHLQMCTSIGRRQGEREREEEREEREKKRDLVKKRLNLSHH